MSRWCLILSMFLERMRGLRASNLIVKSNASDGNGRQLYNAHLHTSTCTIVIWCSCGPVDSAGRIEKALRIKVRMYYLYYYQNTIFNREIQP